MLALPALYLARMLKRTHASVPTGAVVRMYVDLRSTCMVPCMSNAHVVLLLPT